MGRKRGYKGAPEPVSGQVLGRLGASEDGNMEVSKWMH